MPPDLRESKNELRDHGDVSFNVTLDIEYAEDYILHLESVIEDLLCYIHPRIRDEDCEEIDEFLSNELMKKIKGRPEKR